MHSPIEDARSNALHWYSRVSSEGNLSDGSSRLDEVLMQRLGAVRVRVQVWAFQALASSDVVAMLREVSKPT